MSDTPRVYIACLGCYNNGRLVGQWFDAVDAPDEMDEFNTIPMASLDGCSLDVYDAHLTEAHEELWVIDHEGFDGLLDGECSPATAKELAEFLDRLDSELGYPVEAFAALRAREGEHYVKCDDDGLNMLADAYCGEWDSEEEYAEDLATELGMINDAMRWPFACIDWSRAWRELEFGGDNWSADSGHGTVYIFRSV